MKNDTKILGVDIKKYYTYENARKNIVYRLVNTERNRELLSDIPHMEFMDLSIIFKCLVSQDKSGTVSMLVHNAHTKLWGVTVEKLYQTAKENTQRIEGYGIKSIAEAVHGLMKPKNAEGFIYDGSVTEFLGRMPMYVLSNKKYIGGSACMLYPSLLGDFADAAGSSLYIIPSSIHELLLLPAGNFGGSREEIKSIIKEINNTQMQPEEVLSYSLYCYDREEGRISTC